MGSTTAVTDEKGTVKYQYQYSPYGELIEGTYGQVAFLYNGKYGVTSDDNGLYYMRARYYNIDIKRFINQDVVTGSIERSGSLNRYAYVEGNPVNYIDPFGLEKREKEEIKRNLVILQTSFQIASVIFSAVGMDKVSAALVLAADLTVFTLLACYMVDYKYANSQKDKDKAIRDIGTGICNLIFSKILYVLGTGPGLDGKLNETITKKAMELTTAAADCVISILFNILGG